MSKSTLPFNPAEYALVADRITAFYTQYPTGRIITKLVSRDRDIVFRASVYRSAEDRAPAATGWASEREGDGEINLYACLENTETSAIGRALANLGFTASLKRPSREEMQKVERARHSTRRTTRGNELYAIAALNDPSLRVAELPNSPPAPAPDAVTRPAQDPIAARLDIEQLLREAEATGFPSVSVDEVLDKLEALPPGDMDGIAALEAQLRRWIREHRT